jgi:hypothetical protein
MFAAKRLDQAGDCIAELNRRRSEEELACLKDIFPVKVRVL